MAENTPTTTAAPAAAEQAAPLNTLSWVSFALAFISVVPGLVLGIIALRQIRQTGESGRGLAIAAIICSVAAMALIVIAVLVYLAFIAFAVAAASKGLWQDGSYSNPMLP